MSDSTVAATLPNGHPIRVTWHPDATVSLPAEDLRALFLAVQMAEDAVRPLNERITAFYQETADLEAEVQRLRSSTWH